MNEKRTHRTLAEWEAIKAQAVAEAPPDPPTGHMRVKVDDGYEYAPTAEHLRSLGYKVEYTAETLVPRKSSAAKPRIEKPWPGVRLARSTPV